MLLQRPENERFKDISLEFSNTTSVDFTLSDGQVWEEIRLDDANVETNYVNISTPTCKIYYYLELDIVSLSYR